MKTCKLSEEDPCSACGKCYEDKTCECINGALGISCMKNPKPLQSLAPNNVSIFSYNVAANGLGENAEDTLNRAKLIAAKIKDDGYDIIALQEAWGDAFTEVITNAVETTHPYIVFKNFFDGPVKDSGLFVASNTPSTRPCFNHSVTLQELTQGWTKESFLQPLI